MLYSSFPDLRWLKHQAENRFSDGKGWPNVVINVKSGATVRDNIPGPLSLFSNESGESLVSVDNKTTIVKQDHFFISNNSQRYTLQVSKSAETFNIHFGESWTHNVIGDERVEFYNKLYPKDEIVRYLQSQLKVPEKTALEREEIMTHLVVHLLRVNRNEKIRLQSLSAAKLSTRHDLLRRLHLATDYIYSFYDKDISLDDLAKVSMLSKFHFVRGFKEAFGMAPHQFLNFVRIEKAKALLSSGIGVSQTGRQVGITDSSSFSRLFKKHTDVYPTAFRK